jgi:uncharacterized Zn-finger protein
VLADMKALEEDVVSIKSEIDESKDINQLKVEQEQAMLSEQDIDQDIEKSLVDSLSQEYDIKLEDGNKGVEEQVSLSKQGLKKCKKISITKFQCPLCLHYFKNGVILKRHVLRNSCFKQFHCPHCPKSFRSGDKLENHKNFCEKPSECTVCGKSFPTMYRLKQHSITHSDDRPFPCKSCDKTFSRLSDVKVHSRIHTGDRPYKCKECSLNFITSSNLATHVAVHQDIRRFHCLMCPKAFKLLQTLKKHEYCHQDRIRAHSCSTCGQSFVEKGNLAMHEKTHNTDKSFKCRDCDKTFGQQSYLNLHISRSHTKIKPFECNVCGKAFAQRHILNKHSKAHYTNVIEEEEFDHDDVNSKEVELENLLAEEIVI